MLTRRILPIPVNQSALRTESVVLSARSLWVEDDSFERLTTGVRRNFATDIRRTVPIVSRRHLDKKLRGTTRGYPVALPGRPATCATPAGFTLAIQASVPWRLNG